MIAIGMQSTEPLIQFFLTKRVDAIDSLNNNKPKYKPTYIRVEYRAINW